MKIAQEYTNNEKENIRKRKTQAFSTAALSTWNSLPASVLDTDSMAVFKSKLKTHLFTAA